MLMRLFSSHGIRDYDYDLACMLIREDEEGNRDEILRLMRGVTGNNRQNALTYRAKRAYREHDYDEFRSAYDQISAPSKELITKNEYVLSNSPDALLAKADKLFSKKEYDGAENCYRKAAELNCAEGYIGIARIYLTAQKRDLHKAIEAYRSAETMGSSEAAAELSRAVASFAGTEMEDRVQIDFSATGDTKYYNGIAFKGFLSGVPGSVLSGGQYDHLMRRMGRRDRAVGFAVFLNMLERLTEEGRTDA